MQYDIVDKAKAAEVREGLTATWFAVLRAGDMIVTDRRPTLNKGQQRIAKDEGLRLRTKADGSGFYVWFEQADVALEDAVEDDFPPVD